LEIRLIATGVFGELVLQNVEFAVKNNAV